MFAAIIPKVFPRIRCFSKYFSRRNISKKGPLLFASASSSHETHKNFLCLIVSKKCMTYFRHLNYIYRFHNGYFFGRWRECCLNSKKDTLSKNSFKYERGRLFGRPKRCAKQRNGALRFALRLFEPRRLRCFLNSASPKDLWKCRVVGNSIDILSLGKKH